MSLQDLGQALITSTDLNELASRICRRAGELCGADRVALTLLVDAYREEDVEGETRVVLGFHPAIAPINPKAAKK